MVHSLERHVTSNGYGNNPSAFVKLNVLQETLIPEANISTSCSKSALMMLHPTHMYKNDVFIDHTHWRSENKKAMSTALLALNV